MQARAPSSNLEPHAGHSVGVAGTGVGARGGAAGPLPDVAAGTAGLGVATEGATATALAASGGTMNGCLHDGQATRLPAALSGTCIDLSHFGFGQRITCGMILLPVYASLTVVFRKITAYSKCLRFARVREAADALDDGQ